MRAVRFGIFLLVISLLIISYGMGYEDIIYQEQKNPNILLISSYHPGFPTFFQQVDGIHSIFKPGTVNLDIEYMDSKRFPTENVTRLFDSMLSYKLQNLPPYDLILVADDNALNYVLSQQNSLFQGIPIVFFGINNQSMAKIHSSNQMVTGVMENVSIKETLDLMIQLYPNNHEIIALSDNTVSGSADAKTFLSYATKYPDYSFSVLSMSNFSWNEYAENLHTINKSSSVLLLSVFQDKNIKTLNFYESLRLIKENLNVPVFHLWYHGMGNGILGGVLISQHEQARKAASMAEEILHGTPITSVSILNESPNTMVLDYSEILKAGITPEKIPPQSRLINKPVSFFEEYWIYILAAIIIITFQTVVILLLWINIRKRKAAEGDLLAYQGHLEEKVRTRTKELEESNEELRAIQRELKDNIINLSNRERELQKSEEKFRNLVEDINNILVTFTPEGIFTYVNPFAERFFGFNADELIGKHIVGTIIPEHMDESEDLVRFIEDLGQNPDNYFQHENMNVRKNGDVVWILWTNRSIKDANGAVLSIISVGIDITQRIMLEKTIKEVNVKLNLLSSFNRHDLLNLMTSLIMYLEVIAESPDNQENAYYVAQMSKVLSKMRTQIEITRDYEELGGSEPRWVQIGDIIQRLSKIFSDNSIRYDLDILNVEIFADPMLEKAFYNLIDNSVRHGEHVTRIYIHSEHRENGISLIYTDDGIGIPDSNKERIFEKGFGKNSGQGMFLVRTILQISHITIKETGVHGEGARFELFVPDGVWREGKENI